MAKYVVGKAKDTPPGKRSIIEVEGISIAIFNVDGSYHALLNRCPHQGAPLGKGVLVGAISSSCPGEYEYDPKHSFVKCVWHGWEFDLKNGKSWFDPDRKRVKPYPVSVEPGAAIADTGTPSTGGRIPGPYIVQTFPVSVEDDYLVVEVGR